ncbi:MAG TPA: hypothetical protein VK097_10030, partial [Lentibacillus sp.]|uniref:hypothetical protein n=1 Tax=Lentibacillus sp. TaxID=1925746 RepID=UPI002B4B79A8
SSRIRRSRELTICCSAMLLTSFHPYNRNKTQKRGTKNKNVFFEIPCPFFRVGFDYRRKKSFGKSRIFGGGRKSTS